MAEDIKALLDKIHQEGVKVAQEKADHIEAQAREQAGKIVEQAKKEAEDLLRSTKDRLARDEQSQKALLAQAGRDLILSLRGSNVPKGLNTVSGSRDPYGGVHVISPEVASQAKKVYMNSFNEAIKLNSILGKQIIEQVKQNLSNLYNEFKKNK